MTRVGYKFTGRQITIGVMEVTRRVTTFLF